MITTIKNLAHLNKQFEEYKDLDYLPLSREAFRVYVDLIYWDDILKDFFENYIDAKTSSILVISYRGKEIKVI